MSENDYKSLRSHCQTENLKTSYQDRSRSRSRGNGSDRWSLWDGYGNLNPKKLRGIFCDRPVTLRKSLVQNASITCRQKEHLAWLKRVDTGILINVALQQDIITKQNELGRVLKVGAMLKNTRLTYLASIYDSATLSAR